MHLLFLDESGRLEQDDRFCLGGVAVHDRDWSTLRTLWQATLAGHGWPLDRELKWHGIRTGEVPPALADAIVATIAAAPVTCYVIVLDLPGARAAWPERFGTPEADYGTALMCRLEPRFARHPATGAIAGVGLKRFPDPERPDRDLQKLF